MEIAAERFSPLFFFPPRAAASQSTLSHVAGTQGERRRRAMDRKRSRSRAGRARVEGERGGEEL